jgi:diadenosine tetraphosphate (Ap4A) HIT family hydrolase
MTLKTNQHKTFNETPFARAENRIFKKTEYCIVLYDKYPVCENHLLFIPKQKYDYYICKAFEEAFEEGESQVENKKIDGYHLGINMYVAGGQSIMWPHVHFIPRHYDDSDGPYIGSVRLARVGGRIPMSYENHPEHYSWKKALGL